MPKQLRSIQSVPTLRVFTQLPRGPRVYSFSNPPEVKGGPGDPPPGFLVATNSLTEWYVYWAMFKVLNIPFESRNSGPPFMGMLPYFSYQVPMQGGRSLPGGAVPDFVVYHTPSGVPIIIRVVTEYWHLYTSNAKQVADAFQRYRLEAEVEVTDIYDYTFMSDPSGQAVIQQVKGAIGLIEIANPLKAGTARRNKR